jgi:beta-glucosidase
MGYVQGMFPPNVKNVFRANKSFKHLMDAHRRAYSIIHEHHAKAEVGLSHYATCVQPYRNGPVNRLAVWGLDYIRNWRFLDSVKDDVDFIGIQYYHRDVIDVVPRGGKWGFFDVKNPNDWVNDLNWDMYPEGIYQILKRTARYKKPIYITESGLADRDDRKRWEFIRRNLYWIHRAMSEGVDIRGYFHWSLLDNFEWDKGFWPRFGLVAVDFKTDERHIRPSARHYKQVCETNTLIP